MIAGCQLPRTAAKEPDMPDITSLFVTRLYRAKLNELAKKKVDYDELRVTCETIAEDDSFLPAVGSLVATELSQT